MRASNIKRASHYDNIDAKRVNLIGASPCWSRRTVKGSDLKLRILWLVMGSLCAETTEACRVHFRTRQDED